MNERIKQLMPNPWTFPYPDRELYTKEQLEKFAELIVRECAVIIGSMEEPHQDIAKLVKQHFGVE